MKSRSWGLLALVVAALSWMTACGSKTLPAETAQAESPAMKEAVASVPVGTQLGMRAPSFTLPDPNESPVILEDYRGKPVVLVFYRGGW